MNSFDFNDRQDIENMLDDLTYSEESVEECKKEFMGIMDQALDLYNDKLIDKAMMKVTVELSRKQVEEAEVLLSETRKLRETLVKQLNSL